MSPVTWEGKQVGKKIANKHQKPFTNMASSSSKIHESPNSKMISFLILWSNIL